MGAILEEASMRGFVALGTVHDNRRLTCAYDPHHVDDFVMGWACVRQEVQAKGSSCGVAVGMNPNE